MQRSNPTLATLDLQRLQSIVAFVLVAILFGSIPPVTKFTIASMTPAVLLSVRYTIAVFLFMPWIIKVILSYTPVRDWHFPIPLLSIISTRTVFRGISLSNLLEDSPKNSFVITKALLKDSFVIGILTFGIHLGLSFGVQTISANRASFLFGLCVIFVSVIDLIYRRHFSFRIFSAALLAFGGSSLMSWEQSHEPIIGTLWLLSAIACEATILILLEDMAPRHNPLMLSMLRLGVAAILALLLALPELPGQLVVIQANWVPLLYLGSVTAAATWLVIFALQTLPAAEAALIQALEPIFGAVISFFVLGEVFGWRGLIGSGLILTGTLLAILYSPNGLTNQSISLKSEGVSP